MTIIVNDKLNEIIETKNFPHNHPLKDNSIKLDIIRTAVKRKGTEDLHTQPNKIILKEIRQSGFDTDIEYSSLRLVRKSLYCARKKLFPTLPQTLEDQLIYFRQKETILQNLTMKNFVIFLQIKI